ncbi:hypothetical protein BDV96DRAFT_590736 [Lophiotrema nucula]|uniref:Uncharacterized protein n=1 Tax=Lophiotrema nucula TaxID=690887 RepID=A0A6A5YIB0_9PLEO|nr:hypothetical protein BDV96DRAFT_590736 [Lophiotrema nucula]
MAQVGIQPSNHVATPGTHTHRRSYSRQRLLLLVHIPPDPPLFPHNLHRRQRYLGNRSSQERLPRLDGGTSFDHRLTWDRVVVGHNHALRQRSKETTRGHSFSGVGGLAAATSTGSHDAGRGGSGHRTTGVIGVGLEI